MDTTLAVLQTVLAVLEVLRVARDLKQRKAPIPRCVRCEISNGERDRRS